MSGAQIHGGLGAGSPAGPPVRPAQAELDAAGASLGAALGGGNGQTILVEGEAGVGKTRLLDEALRPMAAPERGARAACFEHLQAAPFTPWVDVLHAVLRHRRPASLASERTRKVRAYLQRHLAGVGRVRLAAQPAARRLAAQSDVVALARGAGPARRSCSSWPRASCVLSAARPRRHTSSSSRTSTGSTRARWRCLGHLAGRLTAPRSCCCSPRGRRRTPDALRRRGRRRVWSWPSSHEPESLAMVREALERRRPARRGRRRDLRQDQGQSAVPRGGHPLAAGSRACWNGSSAPRRSRARPSWPPSRSPTGSRGCSMSRIDRLPADTREVLKAGRSSGRSFDARLLRGHRRRAAARRSRSSAPSTSWSAAALVVPGEDGAASVSFRHALVQDVAYESLPFARRRDLHGRVARYLESTQVAARPRHCSSTTTAVPATREKTRLHAVRASEAPSPSTRTARRSTTSASRWRRSRARAPTDACLRSRFEELTGDSLQTFGAARRGDRMLRVGEEALGLARQRGGRRQSGAGEGLPDRRRRCQRQSSLLEGLCVDAARPGCLQASDPVARHGHAAICRRGPRQACGTHPHREGCLSVSPRQRTGRRCELVDDGLRLAHRSDDEGLVAYGLTPSAVSRSRSWAGSSRRPTPAARPSPPMNKPAIWSGKRSAT